MIVTFSRLGRFGRLGNQLFQIASTLGIARRNAAQAIFPVWRYAQLFTGPIPQSITSPGEFPVYREQSFTYQPIELAGSVDLAGFFQSERYFSSIAPEIRQALSPSESIRKQCQSQLPLLLDAGTCSIHVRRGDYVYHPLFTDLAATDYAEVIRLAPTDARGWRNRGLIRLYQGDNKGGVADYDKALQYDPADAFSWNNRGQAKLRLGDKAGAIADLRKALDLRPDLGAARENLKKVGAAP